MNTNNGLHGLAAKGLICIRTALAPNPEEEKRFPIDTARSLLTTPYNMADAGFCHRT